MLTAILALLSSSTFGTLIGAAIAYFNRKVDLSTKRLDLEQERARWNHELAMRYKDIDLAKAEAESRKDVAVIEGRASIDTAAYAAMAAAYQADVGPNDLIDKIRRSVRPVTTYMLLAAALVINGALLIILLNRWGEVPVKVQDDLVLGSVNWVLAQCGMVLGFWFVSRPNWLTPKS